MIGKEKLIARLKQVMATSTADETEVVFVGNESGLTRYANSYIHQNVYESNSRILFRTVLGKKVGVASCNSMVLADLKKTLQDSIEIARQQPENPNFPGLPKPQLPASSDFRRNGQWQMKSRDRQSASWPGNSV